MLATRVVDERYEELSVGWYVERSLLNWETIAVHGHYVKANACLGVIDDVLEALNHDNCMLA